jgi:site-specific DNA-cytosine methylase
VPYVLLENVEALLDRHNGDDPPVIQYLVQQFKELGYQSLAYRTVASAAFGLPNRRKRVFVVASLYGDARDIMLSQGRTECAGGCINMFGRSCYKCHMETLYTTESDSGTVHGAGGSGETNNNNNNHDHDDDDDRCRRRHQSLSYAVDMGNALSQAATDIVPTFTTSNERILLLLADGRSGMLRIEDAERLQGLPEGYTAPCWPIRKPGISAHRTINTLTKNNNSDNPNLNNNGGSASGGESSNSKRWDLLGNAVTVPVARWLGERLANPCSHKYHAVSVHDRRMDHLLDIQSSKNGTGTGGGTGTTGTIGTTTGTGTGTREKLHPWAYVETDGLEEGVLFSYLADGRQNNDDDDNGTEEEEGELVVITPNSGGGTEATLDAVSADADGAGPSSSSEQQQRQPATMAPTRTPINSDDDDDDDDDRDADEEEKKLLFQAAIFHSQLKAQGRHRPLGKDPRQQSPWTKDSWPRSGWYVKGQGLFAVEEMSDAPILAPYIPPAEFITQLGRPPKKGEVDSYVNRLQERGWQTDNTIQFALRNGLHIAPETIQVSRLPSLCAERDMIGPIVWAKDKVSGAWWPGEMVDPMDMPVGRHVGELPVDELTDVQRAASLPRRVSDGTGTATGTGTGTADTTTGTSITASPAAELQGNGADRRVFVCYFPMTQRDTGSTGGGGWVAPRDVLPFEELLEAKEKEAEKKMKTKAFARFKDQLKHAIQDARDTVALKRAADDGNNTAINANAIATSQVQMMRRTRAAAMASAVNLKSRCGFCKTCLSYHQAAAAAAAAATAGPSSFLSPATAPTTTTPSGKKLDCLNQRLRSAALSGHSGAILAACKEGAVGAKVQVWWNGDDKFYDGIIAHWDPINTEHTVVYDDYEIGTYKLWQHSELIRVVSDPLDWVKDGLEARRVLRLAHQRATNEKQQKQKKKAAGNGNGNTNNEGTCSPVPPVITTDMAEYEKQRAQRIMKNQAMMKQIMGKTAALFRDTLSGRYNPTVVDVYEVGQQEGRDAGAAGGTATPAGIVDGAAENKVGAAKGTKKKENTMMKKKASTPRFKSPPSPPNNKNKKAVAAATPSPPPTRKSKTPASPSSPSMSTRKRNSPADRDDGSGATTTITTTVRKRPRKACTLPNNIDDGKEEKGEEQEEAAVKIKNKKSSRIQIMRYKKLRYEEGRVGC